MPAYSFFDTLTHSFIIGVATFGFIFATLWAVDKICDQDEQIKELSSRLEEKMPKIMN